jgi:hypothetical protein
VILLLADSGSGLSQCRPRLPVQPGMRLCLQRGCSLRAHRWQRPSAYSGFNRVPRWPPWSAPWSRFRLCFLSCGSSEAGLVRPCVRSRPYGSPACERQQRQQENADTSKLSPEGPLPVSRNSAL